MTCLSLDQWRIAIRDERGHCLASPMPEPMSATSK
jgi:hypothetical protein